MDIQFGIAKKASNKICRHFLYKIIKMSFIHRISTLFYINFAAYGMIYGVIPVTNFLIFGWNLDQADEMVFAPELYNRTVILTIKTID